MKTKEMRSIKDIRDEIYERLGGDAKDFVIERKDYGFDDLTEEFFEHADGACPIYYGDILKTLMNDDDMIDYVEAVASETGGWNPSDGVGFYELIQQAWVRMTFDVLNEDREDVIRFFATYELEKQTGEDEIPDETWEEIEDELERTGIDGQDEIEDVVRNVLEASEDEDDEEEEGDEDEEDEAGED